MKHKRNLKTSILVLLFLCSSMIFIIQPAKASSPWLNLSWTKRKAITIDNILNPNDLYSYQVKINVNYVPTMNGDFSDLRFTSGDGVTLIPHWIESYIASASAVVWVKVPSIPASSTTTIYMYYGNPSASSASNGEATFEFFDDFETPFSSGWTDKQPIPEITADPAGAVYNDRLYVFGGYVSGNGDIRKETYEYNPALDVWTRKADMPTPRWGSAAVQYGGKIYVFAGQADVVPSQNVYKYSKYSENPLTTIPQYNASGAVHPDVMYFPEGKDGYKYWMVYTPYPPQSKENPSIVRSNDGITWTDNGISNPVIPAGSSGEWNDLENADPDFVYVSDYNKWFMVWAGGDQATDSRKIALAYSSDGKTWIQYDGVSVNGNLNPIILSGDDAGGQPWERNGTISQVSCPTLLYENGVFYLYYVEEASGNNRGKAGFATFTWNDSTNDIENFARYSNNPTIDLPQDSEFMAGVGHLDISKHPENNVYHMYVVRQLVGSSSYELALLTSTDKISWTNKGKVLERGSAGEWDDQHIYRSSPVVNQTGQIFLFDNKIKLYYSGWTWDTPKIGIANITRSAYSGVFGNNRVEAFLNWWGGDVDLSKFQFTDSTDTYTGSITVYFSTVADSPNNRAVVGIYDESLNKVAESYEKVITSVGWQTFDLIGPFNLTENSYYYLASHAPEGNNGLRGSGEPNQDGWKTRAYDGTLPSSLSPLTGQSNDVYSIYCTYTSTTANTSEPTPIHSTNEVYDPTTNTWEAKADVPSEIAEQGLMGVLYSDEIHLFYKQYHYVYYPLNDTYIRKADVPTPRTWGTCAVVNNKIYVIGGYSYDYFYDYQRATDVNEVYDPTTDSWETKNPLPSKKYGVTRENPVIDGKIYVTHGLDQTFYVTVYVYDPSTDTWEQKSSASYPRDGVACGVIQGKLYVVGGRADFEGPYGLDYNEEYDPQVDIASPWTVSNAGKVHIDTSAKHEGNYGLLINDNTTSTEYAEHALNLSRLVVDVDWDMTDELGIDFVQPQGRILLVDPSLANYGTLYYFNDGSPNFKWYTGSFTTLQSGSWNTWYHITIIWDGSNSKVIINGTEHSVPAIQISSDRIRLEASMLEISKIYFDLVRVRKYTPPEPTVSIGSEESYSPQGRISVDTTPVKGEVFVNGSSWGIAPVSHEVDVGTYTVSFGAVTGYITPEDQIVTVLENTTTTVTGVYEPIPVHDLTVNNVTAFPTSTEIGSSVTINVTVKNNGDFGETFDVIGKYDSTIFDTKTGLYLDIGATTTVVLTWNTNATGTYTISAEVPSVAGETNTSDNNFTDGTVTVSPKIHMLTVDSTPINGISFTLDGAPYTTTWTGNLPEGSHTITMPSTWTVGTQTYNFKQWEDNSTNQTRTISLTTNMIINATYELYVGQEGTINGTITDLNTGNPIAGATVEANGYSTTTGADGTYAMGVAVGTYTVTASATGYFSNTKTDIAVNPGVTTTANFALTPLLGAIKGTVIGASTSSPIAEATVTADASYSATTDTNGYYIITNVTAGTYTVRASALGYDDGVAYEVVVNNGAETTVNFELWPILNWTQTTMSDFNTGTTNNVEIAMIGQSDGDVVLGKASGENLVFSDNFDDNILESGWIVDKASTTQWINIDLGSTYSVDKVTVYQSNFPNYFTKDYQIQVSTDGSTYETVASNTLLNNINDLKTNTFTATTARYVRILVMSHYTTGISQGLNEVEVFQAGDPTTNIALNELTTASSEWPSSYYTASHAVDGLKGTTANSWPYPWLCADDAKAASEIVVAETGGTLMIYAPHNTYAHIERTLGLVSDPEILTVSARIMVQGYAGVSWRPQIALYWASGDWCGIGISNYDFITNVNVYSLQTEGLISHIGAEPNVYFYVKIVLTATSINFSESRDGVSWTTLRTVSRPASYIGPPSLLIVGKGYGNGGFYQFGSTYPEPNLDNNYPSFSGDYATSYIDDVTVMESGEQYFLSGVFTSSIYDANSSATWKNIYWSATLPSGTSITLQTRTGNTSTPDASWSDWSNIYTNSGEAITSPEGRYIQYRAVLQTTDSTITPVLQDVTIMYIEG